MSAHVLLNLLNKFGKSDKMLGLPSILSLFCNELLLVAFCLFTPGKSDINVLLKTISLGEKMCKF